MDDVEILFKGTGAELRHILVARPAGTELILEEHEYCGDLIPALLETPLEDDEFVFAVF